MNTTAAVATGNHTFKVRATGSAGDCGPPNPQFEESANVTLAIAAPSAVNTTTTVASSANPSVFGQSVTFTATVTASAGTPSGSVTFKDGAAALGTVNLANGQATVSTSALIVGSHSITVDYTGVAGSFNASTSAPLSQVVNQAQTTTTLASSLNPSTFGQPVTFTATVAAVSPGAGTPTGNVDFKEGATTLGAVPLSNIGGVQTATFTTSALVVGTHNVTATYAGATNFVTSTSTQVAQVINQIATTLAVDPATGAYGGTATLRATLKTGTTPLSGKAVAFSLNGTPAGTATTNASGVAILPNVSLAGVNAGTYSPGASSGVRAEFTADATLAGSFGTALLKVDPKALTITASDRTKAYGEAVTFAGTEFTATGVVSGDAVASVALSSVGAAATAAVCGVTVRHHTEQCRGHGAHELRDHVCRREAEGRPEGADNYRRRAYKGLRSNGDLRRYRVHNGGTAQRRRSELGDADERWRACIGVRRWVAVRHCREQCRRHGTRATTQSAT